MQNIDYSPHYNFVSPNQNSFFNLFINWLERETSCRFKVIPLPTKRLELTFSQQQKLDFIYPDNPDWHRNANLKENKRYFSVALTRTIGSTIVRENNAKMLTNEFNSLAVPQGFTPTHWLDSGHTIEYREVSSALAALKMVQSNRVDGADVEYNVARHLMKKHQMNNMVIGENLPFIQTTFHLATIKHPRLIDKLNSLVKLNKEQINALKSETRLMPSAANYRY